ncbi:MAG: hypothetical protein HXL11_01240 [Candidatus Nanosynbacter sp.]|nr:hypothetical protein [Candidatus Nanosynbacter sp.]
MNKKSIIGALGIAGLTLLGGLALTNQTYAQEATSSEVTVQVTVLPNGQSVAIKSPTSDSKVLENQVPLNIDFTKSKTIEYEIKLTDKDGTTTTIANETVDVSNAGAANSGSKKIPLDMQQLTNGVFGKVSIKVTVDGKAETADTVEFNYVPVAVEKTQTNPRGYTGFRIAHAGGVAKVKVTLKDKAGHKVGDKEIEITDPVAMTNGGTIELNSEEINNKLDKGDYTLEVVALNGAGDDLEKPELANFKFTGKDEPAKPEDKPATPGKNGGKKTPAVPNTGGSVFAGMNLSSSDFLASGIAVFAFLSLLAVVFLKKGKKSGYRR